MHESGVMNFARRGVAVLSFLVFAFCSGCEPGDSSTPYEPKNQTEQNAKDLVSKFLNSKIKGTPDDQATCMEKIALEPLPIKSYVVTGIDTSGSNATVLVTNEAGEKKRYRFSLMAVDVRNGLFCIMGWKPL
jgi:hypothetical protein